MRLISCLSPDKYVSQQHPLASPEGEERGQAHSQNHEADSCFEKACAPDRSEDTDQYDCDIEAIGREVAESHSSQAFAIHANVPGDDALSRRHDGQDRV